jgi:hypothetical protein
MAIDVEAIWAALFARVSTVPGFTTYSRRRRDYGLELLPALVVLDDAGDEVEVDMETRVVDGLPASLRLTGEIVILTETSNEDLRPTAKLNGLLKAVREALERQPADALGSGPFAGDGPERYYTNLGGLIYSLQILRVEKGDGSVTGQVGARMDIVMETPPPGA